MPFPNSSPPSFSTDVVVFGGGIAGLWILNQLLRQGFSAVLLESSSLGNGQSIASQGIIHGGLKYALGGAVSGATQAISDMPGRWQACLAGQDPVDLRGCRLLSDRYYMWSEGNYRSRLKAFLGSKTLRGKIEPVSEKHYPKGLHDGRGQGSLYSLSDFVIDSTSLLTTLASNCDGSIFGFDPATLALEESATGAQVVYIETEAGAIQIDAQRCVFAAGEGNQELLKLAGLKQSRMQVRPLNMVLLRGASLPLLYVHCIGDSFSLTPRLTVTSHTCANGDVAWYLGGEIAETGVDRTDREQIDLAGTQLRSVFPWVELADTQWACLRINRAEGEMTDRSRPDSAFLGTEKNYLVVWPTKFTLSPALADQVGAELSSQGIQPSGMPVASGLDRYLRKVSVAPPPWETCFE